jgi:hypothetical protein
VAVCPKEIKVEVIAQMTGDFLRASWRGGSAARRRSRGFEEAAGGDEALTATPSLQQYNQAERCSGDEQQRRFGNRSRNKYVSNGNKKLNRAEGSNGIDRAEAWDTE